MAEEQKWRGKLGVLSQEELQAFLQEGVVCRLACLKPDGRPYVVPCWFEYSEGVFWIIPRQRSVWAKHIEKDGRVALTIDETGPPYRKVLVEGDAAIAEQPNVGGQWVPIAERMSVRYLGPNGPKYLEPTLRQPRWLIKVTPFSVKTWQGVGWHPKYWVETETGPSYEEAHGL